MARSPAARGGGGVTPDRAGAGLTEAQLAKMDQAVAYGYWDSASVATEDVRRLVAAVRALTAERDDARAYGVEAREAIGYLNGYISQFVENERQHNAALAEAQDEARRAAAQAERLDRALSDVLSWLSHDDDNRSSGELIDAVDAALAGEAGGPRARSSTTEGATR